MKPKVHAREQNLIDAIAAAERFVRQACKVRNELRRTIDQDPGEAGPYTWPDGAHNAAMKRASMDLTKALAVIRKPWSGA